MNDSILVTLFRNAALLLAMVVVFDLITSRQRLQKERARQVLAGLIIGSLSISLMLDSFRIESGIIFDTRSVLLSLSGLFLGVIPTLFAMAIAVVYRIWMGGAGALTGICVILSTGAVGILWRNNRKGRLEDISALELYAFGVIVHLVMLAMMLTLQWEAAWRVLSGITLPVLLVYPLSTVVLGLLLANRVHRQKTATALVVSEERTRLALSAAHMGTYDWDIKANRIVWSRGHEALWGFNPGEFDGTYEAFSGRIHPEDVSGTHAEIARCIADGVRFEHEFRVVWPDGSVHWVTSVGEFSFDVARHPERMHGVVMETTERHRAEEKIAGQLQELRRWQHVMMDREDRVLELKKEVNELLAREGQPPRYPVADGKRDA